jgi:hypothetical protein
MGFDIKNIKYIVVKIQKWFYYCGEVMKKVVELFCFIWFGALLGGAAAACWRALCRLGGACAGGGVWCVSSWGKGQIVNCKF